MEYKKINQRHMNFKVENPDSVKNLERLAKEKKIERIFPLEKLKTNIHVYKVNGFNIASYLDIAREYAEVEFSRYNNQEEKIENQISWTIKETGMSLKQKN